LGFSVFSFFKVRRLNAAQFDIERDTMFEGRLADWPTAFVLHGINIEAARAEGVSPEQIAYMILNINGLTSYCGANRLDIYKHLKNSDYRQRMFAQPGTRKVWRYARLCIPAKTASKIDKYIAETHGDEYQPLESC
jgi:hypothetical protein